MTDDEVQKWLDGAERDRADSGPEALDLARTLAETRRDLADLASVASWLVERVMAEVPQPHCPDVPGHLRGALKRNRSLATMPRPK